MQQNQFKKGDRVRHIDPQFTRNFNRTGTVQNDSGPEFTQVFFDGRLGKTICYSSSLELLVEDIGIITEPSLKGLING